MYHLLYETRVQYTICSPKYNIVIYTIVRMINTETLQKIMFSQGDEDGFDRLTYTALYVIECMDTLHSAGFDKTLST